MPGCISEKKWFYCTLLLLQVHLIVGQSLEPLHFNYTTNDGLPSSETYEIIQDRRGFIWISTDNGVCRYDGHNFEHLGAEQGLTDRTILFMHEDHRGWIWMNSVKGNFFIHTGDTIVPFAHNQCIQEVRNKFDYVHDFFVDTDGTLHLSLYGYGIMTIDPSGSCNLAWQLEVENYSKYGVYAHEDGVLQLSQVVAAMAPRHGFALHVNSLGIDSSQAVISLEDQDFERLSAKGFFYVFPLRNQYLFQARSMMGIMNSQLQKDTTWKFSYGTINCLKELSTGQLLLGFFEKKGLQLYESVAAFRQGLPPLQLFEDHTVSHIAEDRNGGVWVGTIERGVYYIPSLDKQTLDLQLGTDLITALTQTENEEPPSLFMASEKGRLFEVSTQTVKEHPSLAGTFGMIKLHFLDNQKTIFGANPMAIFDGSQWQMILEWDNDESRLESRVLNDLVLTTSESELMGFTKFGKFFRIKTDLPEVKMQLAFLLRRNLYVTAALQESPQSYWTGTQSGLYYVRLTPSGQPEIRDSLLHGIAINTMLPLSNRAFLIGTKDQGLWQSSIGADAKRQTTQILADQSITSLHRAPDASIWAVSVAGIHKFEYQDSLIFQGTLSTLNGLPSNEILDLGFTPGHVWVASKQGLTSHPFDFDQRSQASKVHLVGTFIDGAATPPGQVLQLAYNSQCRIRFSAFDFSSNRRTRYRYRLGPEDRWVETIEPEINFSNLNAGDYTLELQTLSTDNSWGDSTKQAISVRPPYWRSAWFFFLCLSLGLLLLYALFRRRLHYLSREKERLALKEEVDQLKQQAYRAQMNPHFIFNCLSTIQGMIMGDAADKDAAVRLLANFSQLIRYALDASRQELVSLKDELDLLRRYLLLERERFSQSFDFSIQVASELEPDWIQIPPMLIQPYVENAVLHGMADKESGGCILLKYSQEGQQLKVSIEDNGPGIYQRQAQQQKKGGKYRHKSVGMMITRKRLEMLSEGQYPPQIEEIVADDGSISGTRITLSLPL